MGVEANRMVGRRHDNRHRNWKDPRSEDLGSMSSCKSDFDHHGPVDTGPADGIHDVLGQLVCILGTESLDVDASERAVTVVM